MLDVSDKLFWESCRECSYHFTGLGVLEFYSQCLKSVTSCIGKAVGNAVITSLALGHRALSLAGTLLPKDKSARVSPVDILFKFHTFFFSLSGRIIPYI